MAHLVEPITRETLARALGVTVRTLSRDFTARHGVGPMAFIRQKRIEAVHHDLLSSDPEAKSVSDVAVCYGFTELGRFAGSYRAIFGELPSETLRR
jgi:transcriptional regulator GlxA family with amidase domain